MWLFLARRLLSLPPLLLVISFLTYLLLQAAPGDFYSSREFDPKFTQDYIMALRQAVGKVEEIPAQRRAAALPAFRPEGREYAFDEEGRLLRDGKRADPTREQTWVKRFEWPPASDQTWTLTQEGR